jgi:MyTH4 domain
MHRYRSKQRAQTLLPTLPVVLSHCVYRLVLGCTVLCSLALPLGNPDVAHVIQGWKLFYLSLGCFLPSEDFTNFLLDFLHTHAKLVQADSNSPTVKLPSGEKVRGERL